MKKYKDVVLFQDEKLESGLGESLKYTEMSDFDRAFLCGMIRKKKPHKILEVGMAAGATTAVILNCMRALDLDCRLISVDYSEAWYKDGSQRTGFVAEEFKASQADYTFRHEVYLGDVAAAHLEKICEDGKIDFLILDTTHSLPGEVLDFIACFPYLTEDAVVVLHDVALSCKMPGQSEAIATKLLFDVVKADKYYMKSGEEAYGLANIAAFQMTEDTGENMLDVFSALQMEWAYLLREADYQKYLTLLMKHYEQYCIDIFMSANKRQNNSHWLNSKIERHYPGDIGTFRKQWQKAGNVLLYGCGDWGELYCRYAEGYQLPVAGMAVSDGIEITDSMKETFGVPIYHLSEIPYEKDACRIVLAVGAGNRELFLQNCTDKGFEIL